MGPPGWVPPDSKPHKRREQDEKSQPRSGLIEHLAQHRLLPEARKGASLRDTFGICGDNTAGALQ
jgi:hypothetical protein